MASQNTVCTKCGCSITPDRIRRVDFQRVECPECPESSRLQQPGRELAQRLLNARRGAADKGENAPRLHARRITVEDLAQAVLVDHQVQAKKDQLNPRLRREKHLKPVFGHVRAADVTRPQIDRYVAARLGAQASNATIMRELAFLKRAFCLGVEHEKITRIPTFPRLAENNTREGFPTDEQFERLKQACAAGGLWLRVIMEVSATCGWRKIALLAMRVQNVDLLASTIRQEASTTKNREAVEVKLVPDLRHLLTACMIGKRPEDFLFTREGNRPVRGFRDEWERATLAAGAPHLLFHDLCRFAARYLDNAGVSQKVGMQIMGRKTPSIYFRYRIVDRKDKDAGVDKLVEYRQ